ncbi:hypothetical protein chiPu_0016118 [Chiloscyllium punctatum]|uniref:Uncharacterized protein n=1 Tax=Chiloscyllium punctatum TaxID=137246 RepID=A0A401T4U3_CHIPU|nr:hypothetical protein [Chiloscyllium punctatum]
MAAAAALGLRVRGLRQVLIVRSGFQAVPLTTKATAPQKKKKVKESVGKPVEEPDKEILDTSTYKNTQHHDYNPLTFIDMDVDMAKYRLPQPSSGRITPRH